MYGPDGTLGKLTKKNKYHVCLSWCGSQELFLYKSAHIKRIKVKKPESGG